MKLTVEIESVENLYSASQVELNLPKDKFKLAKLYTHLHEMATYQLYENQPNIEDDYIITFMLILDEKLDNTKDNSISQTYSSRDLPIYFDDFINQVLLKLKGK